MPKLTAIVNTKNSAKYLDRCLQSLSFAHEIIVVDMESDDETKTIAHKHHATIIGIPQASYVEMVRNDSIKLATNPWILLVDPDEVISPTLQEKILATIFNQDSSIVAYQIARKNFIFGKWIQHSGWWPDYQIRLFRKGKVRWSGVIHQKPEVDGTLATLLPETEFAIDHDNYRSLDEYFEKMLRYTQAEVDQPAAKKTSKFYSNDLLKVFFDDFFRRYYQKNGDQDGLHGTTLALLQSFYQITAKLRAWERQQFPQSNSPLSPDVVDQIMRDWKFWQASNKVQHSTGWRRFYWLVRKYFRV